MEIRKLQERYLVFCKYRKELDDKTLKAYRIDLRQYFEWVEGEAPGKAEIEEYITKLHINFKQKTVKRKLASVKAFYSYLEEEELIEENLQSGLICFKGKGNKERYVQIGNYEVLKWMQEYYLENQREIEACGFFFVNNRGGRFTEQSIRLMLKKYTKAAGIRRNITPHMFRHSFATYLIEEGVDVSCIQQILGHSSIKTTQIYIHVAARKQAEILQQYHPRNSMKIKVA